MKRKSPEDCESLPGFFCLETRGRDGLETIALYHFKKGLLYDSIISHAP